jgi:hypothetical protein
VLPADPACRECSGAPFFDARDARRNVHSPQLFRMNKPLFISVFSLIAVSSPGVLLGDDRLDAPGPGYRHQVERFAPKQTEPRPFQLQIMSPFGPVEAYFVDTAASSLNGSNRLDVFPVSALPAPSDFPDFSRPIQVERSAPKETGSRPFQLQIGSPFGPLDSEAAADSLNASNPIHAFMGSSFPAPSDLADFSHPIRLFDAPRAPVSKLLPENSLPISPRKSP